MSLPKSIDSYPPEFLEALRRCHAEGEVRIPTLTPLAMRLQFQGLRGALRKAEQAELADQVMFIIEGPHFILRLRANQPLVSELAAALKPGKSLLARSAMEESEKALARILGEKA